MNYFKKIFYKYINKEGKQTEIRIFGTDKTLDYLNDKHINQYFIDGTYKIIPNIDNIQSLVLIIGFNFEKNLYLLCSLITLGDEKEETYDNFYKILKMNFNFEPHYITCDFMKSNLNSIRKNFKNNTKIITCFFHLVQCWWRKANHLHLRNKNYKENTKELINNLKLLPFLDIKNMIKFYEEIKRQKKFDDEFYELFFKYMEKTWIGYEERGKKMLNI